MGSASFEKPSTSTHIIFISPDLIFSNSCEVFSKSYLSWNNSRSASFASAVLEYLSYKNLADFLFYNASLPTIPNFFATHHVLQFTLCVPERDAFTIDSKSYLSFSTDITDSLPTLPFDDIMIRYASDLESTRYPLFAESIAERSVESV